MSGQLSVHRSIALAIVLALHLLAVWFLLRATFVTMASRPLSRVLPITLWLAPVKKPEPAVKKKKLPHAAPSSRARPVIALPPSMMPRRSPGTAIWQGIGRALDCGNIALSPQQREHCKHRLVAMPGADAKTRALIVKVAPSDALTPAEQRLHEMRTQDPCLADEAAHLPFCIYRIIYGNKGP